MRKSKRMLVCLLVLAAVVAAGLPAAAGLADLKAEKNAAAQEASGTEKQSPEVAAVGQETGPGTAIEGRKEKSLEDAIGMAAEELVIVLDPGHGGEDEGCSRNGVLEKELNLTIALAVQERLEALGYQTLLTREDDRPLSLEERVQAAKEAEADLYVSIHQNASEENQAQGVEVWYSGRQAGTKSERLAMLLDKYIVEATGARRRELVATEDLYVIRECTMPSCLVETGFLSNREERQKLTSAEYQQQLADGIAEAIDLYFHPKTMYLTFDDGPSEENTNAILDILKERNIKATFFLVGENVVKHPETARRIAEEGHTIGIHCNSHSYEKIYASVDSYLADFEEARQIVKEITGVDARLFRFPGGSINSYNKKVYQGIIEEMTKRGYIYYDWNASLEDATAKPQAETLIHNAVSTTLGRRKVVMLAHDIVHQTALCLEEMLDQFPEYQMKPLTEEVAPIQF